MNQKEGKPEFDNKGINKTEFIEMVREGVKKAKIARHFNINRLTVYNRINQWHDEIYA